MRISEVLYDVLFMMLFGYRAVGGHEGFSFYPVVLLIAMFCFGWKLMATKHTVLEYLMTAVLLSFALLVYIRTGEKGLFLDYLMMLGIEGVSERRLFRLSATVLGTAMMLLSFLSVFGFIQDVQFGPYGRYGRFMLMRRSLGYPHVNTLLTTYIILMMLCLYLVGNRSRKQVLGYSVLLWLGALYLFLYCDSMTGLIISTGYLVLNYLFQFGLRYRSWEKLLIWAVYPLVNLFVFAGTLLYRPEWKVSIPRLKSLAERFRLAALYMENYPLTLFGVRIVIPETELYGIDMSQLQLLLNLGLVAFVTVSFLYWLVVRDLLREKNGGALAIVVMLTVMGISDPLLYNLSCKNLIFIFMGIAWYRWLRERSEGCPEWLRRELLPFPWGEGEISADLADRYHLIRARVSDGVKTLCHNVRGAIVTIAISVVIAALYAAIAGNHIEPVRKSYEAGVFEFMRRTVSVGVWSCLIMNIMRLSFILFGVAGTERKKHAK